MRVDPITVVIPPRAVAPIRAIAEAVAAAHGLSVREMLGTSRRREVAWPRQDAMRLARTAGYSLPRIGRALGRDHSTVLYGVRRSEERMQAALDAPGAPGAGRHVGKSVGVREGEAVVWRGDLEGERG